MQINSEAAMTELAQACAGNITLPAVFELIGDVGVGKTTFTRGLAAGLGVSEPVTSPSFTISKRYAFQRNGQPGELIHYDFYRLDDPGIMREELAETLAQPNTVVIIEWGGDVAELLPAQKYQFTFSLNPDETRTVTANPAATQLLKQSAGNYHG